MLFAYKKATPDSDAAVLLFTFFKNCVTPADYLNHNTGSTVGEHCDAVLVIPCTLMSSPVNRFIQRVELIT